MKNMTAVELPGRNVGAVPTPAADDRYFGWLLARAIAVMLMPTFSGAWLGNVWLPDLLALSDTLGGVVFGVGWGVSAGLAFWLWYRFAAETERYVDAMNQWLDEYGTAQAVLHQTRADSAPAVRLAPQRPTLRQVFRRAAPDAQPVPEPEPTLRARCGHHRHRYNGC